MSINSNANTLILAQKVVEQFAKQLVVFNAFSTDFAPAPVSKGSQVKVATVTTNNAVSAFTGEYIVPNGDLDAFTISIDKHYYVPFSFSDVDLANSSFVTPEVIEKHAMGYANKLAEYVFSDVLSVVTPGNFSTNISTASGFGYNEVSDLVEEADDLDWPKQPRALVMNSALANSLRKDIKKYDFMGDTEVVREGSTGRIAGFDTYTSPYIPTANSLKGFAASPDAIAIANRVIVPSSLGNNILNFEIVTDPETGLSLGFRSWYDPNKGRDVHVIEVAYGYAVGKADGLIRIV